MKKIFLLIIVSITLCSCQPKCTDDPNLTSDELSWIACYSDKQTLIFKSNSGSFDTATISKGYFSNIGTTDGNGCVHSYQNGSIVFNNLHNGNGFGIFVSHYNQWNSDNLNSAKISFDISSSGPHFSSYAPQNNIIINGINYNNVYILSGPTGPAKVYYTKQNGVLRFDDYQGVQWVKIN